ncbi:MAG: DUF2797 domain-containing protein [Mariniphaga sp.]|nr:DUF2797 domain-containing protein [Mariniphaga sp.]
MRFEGNILKMRSELANPVNYFLPVGESEVPLNELISKPISFLFSGKINCISCGKQTKTSFAQGFCYNCLQTAPQAGESVLRPELSKAHLSIARDMDWAEKHDLIDHYVYLALSSELKVGVTRHHQVPTRWIDQGASSAVILAKTPNRHIAGIIEVWLKKILTDKTNWRAMLKNEIAKGIDILKEKSEVFKNLPAELQKYYSEENKVTQINYPVSRFPEKIKSLSFDKQPEISGSLVGVKGQYLIFEDDSVLNIRKHNGYYLEVNY